MEESLLMGLIGSYLQFKASIENGADKEIVLNSWKGGIDESKDFSFHQHYIETKTEEEQDTSIR